MGKLRIANLYELTESMDRSHGERYGSRHFALGATLGAQKLGYNVTELPPGKTGFPFHFHHVNEELFIVLDGSGTLRTAEGTHPLKRGDVVCCPPGPEGGHQITNTGSEPMRYLALSTVEDPEVVEYPDSGKYGVIAGRPPGRPPWEARFWAFAFAKDRVDYWDGED